jgi:hypothetical protein
MSVLRNLESRIAGLVEGTFGRVFKTEVRPVELARKLAKEMDEHRTVSVSRTYVPNEYVVWLSPKDRARYDGVEHEVAAELSAYLLEHARRERVSLVSTPVIEFRTDEQLQLGEFGIQARLVRPAEAPPGPARAQPGPARPVEQGDHGHTMVYSSAARVQESLEQDRSGVAELPARPRRAFVVAEGKRMPVPSGGAVIGRSRECDIVLADANVSRRHAEIRWAAQAAGRDGIGTWTIADLGSTNGVRVGGRAISGATPISGGDRVELGTVPIGFEVDG